MQFPLLLLNEGVADASLFLLVVPVALCGVRFGFRGGFSCPAS